MLQEFVEPFACRMNVRDLEPGAFYETVESVLAESRWPGRSHVDAYTPVGACGVNQKLLIVRARDGDRDLRDPHPGHGGELSDFVVGNAVASHKTVSVVQGADKKEIVVNKRASAP